MEMLDEIREQEDLKFEELLSRFKAKMALIPEEYYPALGWLYAYRQIQDQRMRLANRANQLKRGKRVFWGSVLYGPLAETIYNTIIDAAEGIEEQEARAARELHKALRKTSWYLEVAVPAAKGVGMSENAGTLTAAKILDAYASPSRFNTFGQFIRYSRLAPENGRAPRRERGQRIHYNPKAWQALFDLSESWNKVPGCYWRQRWDEWKGYYRERYPDYPAGRIHNMARRKVLREFLHDLWDLWNFWEVKYGVNR